MKLKHILFSHRSLTKRTIISPSPSSHIYPQTLTTSTSSLPHLKSPNFHHPISPNPNPTNPTLLFSRNLHSLQVATPPATSDESEPEEDSTMTEFLSRFVWIMRGKLADAYPDCDKSTINAMLLLIAERVVEEVEKGGAGDSVGPTEGLGSTDDFSEDLWKTVWEVSQMVLEDMKKAKKKEKMKMYIQSEEVKEMCRFASEVGVRGNMLREFRFKWAKEKMEEVEFYENLQRMREEARAQDKEEEGETYEHEGLCEEGEVVGDGSETGVVVKPKVAELPQRRGKIKYKIYGLDLSDPKWAEVAYKTHEHEKQFVPEDPKPITGKCKLVTEKILNLTVEDDPRALLAEWMELLKPSRVDWSALLDRLKERGEGLYFKIYEQIIDENSFQAGIRDFSRLIDVHAKANRIDEAEEIIKKMSEKGIQPDILTSIILLHMYSKAGNLDRAKAAFDTLKSLGFQPDLKAYSSMVMAYVDAGEPRLGEWLLREMENRDMKPTKEVYMALLRSFSERKQLDGVKRIMLTMQFVGIQPTMESCTLLVEAYSRAGQADKASENFDYMRRSGFKPDDRCTASLLSAYEKNNHLDRALDILLELEKDGFEPGVATYTVLVDWLGKLQLVDEAEEMLRKITEKVDTPPLKVQVSLCDMYSKAKDEKKALQALGILEGKKDQLDVDDFERVIKGLIAGGLVQDASRVKHMMEARGFSLSDSLKVSLSSQAIRQQRPVRRY